MPFRFVDLDTRPSGYKDFISRRRSPSLVEMFVIAVTIILTSVGMILLIDDKLALTGIMFTMIGLACVYLTANTRRNRDLLQSTEFHNALFASALARNYAFCLIAANDGTVVYCNPGFRSLFPGTEHGHNVSEWLSAGNAPASDYTWIIESLKKGAEGQAALAIEDRDKHKLNMQLFIEPIERPAGFMLVRGREQKSSAK